MESNWYETFFQGVALEFWNQVTTPEQTRAEADFLERKLGPGPGARILDVPCGSGRHAVELAARGYRVCGIDIAPENIADARRRAGARGVSAAFERGDMRRLPRPGEFDGAYCFGNSFGYLDHQGNREFLAAVSGA